MNEKIMNEKMTDFWVIPNETKKVLIKAEKYIIENGILKFYRGDSEVAFFRWDGIVGVQLNIGQITDKEEFVMPYIG